jgi:GT2 family glycosyltransferase/glycosyltransferase involved in cell wall biosynthesis
MKVIMNNNPKGATQRGESPQSDHGDYFELHYQFMKFRQRPLIRIAAWLESFLPENGRIERFFNNVIIALSILRNYGARELLVRLKYRIRRTIGDRSGSRSSAEFIRNGDSVKLTKKVCENLLREYSDKPAHLPDILILPFIDWEYRFQRPQHFAEQLAQLGHRVFYVQAHFEHHNMPEVRQLKERLFLIRLPEGRQKILFTSTLSEENVIQLVDAFVTLVNAFNIHSAILVVDFPFWRKLAIRLQEKFRWRLIYDCLDDFSGFSNSSSLAAEDEKLLLDRSDLVFSSSHVLHKKTEKSNVNSVMVLNGADYEVFHKAATQTEKNEITALKHPIIGYYGAIADWFDTRLVGKLADSHPQWTFVLIGSTELADLKPLKGLSNVHLLSEKKYSQLPGYLSNFDVCIIPFIKKPLTDAANPVKLFEFLSAGKPIVAANLKEVSHYREFVFLAETLQDWENCINKAIVEEKSLQLLTQRFNFAEQNTWKARAQVIESSITRLFPKISIIILTFNNLSFTKLCLESIISNTEYPNYELIIVDNASSDGTLEYISEFMSGKNNVSLLANKENLGFAAGNNLGAKLSSGEYLVFLNNDTIVTPGWLYRLYLHLIKNPSAGMVGPVTNAIGNEAKIEIDYSNLEDINIFAARRAQIFPLESFKINVLALYCCMISRGLFEQIGGLDERYKIGMFEDDDLARKVEQAGYNLLCAEDVYIHHFHGATFKLLSDQENQRIFFENKLKFENKWGIQWQMHKHKS